jgi:hypothetical protein
MRRMLIPTIAGLALIATTELVAAQGAERGGEGRQGPSGGQLGGAHNPGGGMPGHSGGPPRGEMNLPHRGAVEGGHRTEGEQRRAEPQNTQARERASQREQRRGEQERARAEQQREPNRNAERERSEERQRRSAEQPGQRPETHERAVRSERVGEQPEQLRQARTRLSMQDRERLHRSFDLEHGRLTNPSFDWHVGHRVPHNVHLSPVPLGVVGFFPDYRGYDYFVVGDDVCIVNPQTYEVVDVIDQTYWRSPPTVASLRLSGAQIAFIRDSIPADFPEAGLRLRLALGAEIPDSVEDFEFPATVLDRIPELSEFRFLVTDEQIVIVDPGNRSIALVIDRA